MNTQNKIWYAQIIVVKIKNLKLGKIKKEKKMNADTILNLLILEVIKVNGKKYGPAVESYGLKKVAQKDIIEEFQNKTINNCALILKEF